MAVKMNSLVTNVRKNVQVDAYHRVIKGMAPVLVVKIVAMVIYVTSHVHLVVHSLVTDFVVCAMAVKMDILVRDVNRHVGNVGMVLVSLTLDTAQGADMDSMAQAVIRIAPRVACMWFVTSKLDNVSTELFLYGIVNIVTITHTNGY